LLLGYMTSPCSEKAFQFFELIKIK